MILTVPTMIKGGEVCVQVHQRVPPMVTLDLFSQY